MPLFTRICKLCCIRLHKGSLYLAQTKCMIKVMNPRNWACKKIDFLVLVFGFGFFLCVCVCWGGVLGFCLVGFVFYGVCWYHKMCLQLYSFTDLWWTYLIYAPRKSFIASRCWWNAAASIMSLMKCLLQISEGQNGICIKPEKISSLVSF